ncbi:organomercurial transporter MerC [bacterium]|nr:organomercurial transporter MerC [bacterium]
MSRAPKFAEKFAALGTIVAAMGCAACFPALGALAASVGLGFLSAYEGVLISKLLPFFAILVIAINLFYWWQHRVHWRGLLSLLGPSAVLLTLYPLWKYGWSTYLFYAALAHMLSVSVLDVLKPPRQPACPT